MDTEYSKRVYQGVRVKHTVKDLLAEKRSRQPNGPRYSGGATTPPSFVQMPGSHYYSMRRPFISESDYCTPTKQFPTDVYSSGMGSKPLGCEPSSVGGYPSLIDCYYPETFGDYGRATTAFSSTGGSVFPSTALSSLLPPFSGETPHLFLQRESWDQSVPEPLSQVEGMCAEGLGGPVGVPPDSMTSPDRPGSPSNLQYRSPSHSSSSMGPPSSIGPVGAQPYALHTLEDVHYHPLTASTYTASSPSFSCPPYMASAVGDLASKMAPLNVEEAKGHRGLTAHSDAHPSWAKEEAGSPWTSYEIRRSY